MSWSASFSKPVKKSEADKAISELTNMYAANTDPAAEDQIRIAKIAAEVLLANVPGPYIQVTMNGHANGVGWQKKEGWANDSITVTVTQINEDDMKYFNK